MDDVPVQRHFSKKSREVGNAAFFHTLPDPVKLLLGNDKVKLRLAAIFLHRSGTAFFFVGGLAFLSAFNLLLTDFFSNCVK